ncbi:hypothetical protein PENSUB_4491 [Penicillium subrubescens]|uniref:Glycoside hydrolase family 43 protein n=1 Tax=Penicillium subrubescens TaxID=1316194 RepID=A0A1Q5UCD5_9EURO|nr:hypothetical protein PENSUB_4491 [Penicillium subrubescens]
MRVLYAILATLLAAPANSKYIVPGGRWHDTNGTLINAHGAGITFDQKTGRFWWFGEYKTQAQPEGPIDSHPYISPDNIIQRPKVAYSPETDDYHMWWHADNSTYGLLLQGHAVSSTIGGPYTFVDATAPLGNWSQDFGMFTDYKDGRSYALYSNGDSVNGRDVYISSMNDNLTALEKAVYRFPKFDLEAPSIMQTEKSYWALMSHKTGYRPNITFSRSKTGEWTPIKGTTYTAQNAKTSGDAYKQEAVSKATYRAENA